MTTKRATPRIEVVGVQKVFRSRDGREVVQALRDINLEIFDGEFICILGPSGCGKSTLLNAIAGFSRPTAGRLVANGRVVTAPGPDRAMVFQEYALFPWMTVWDNVAFGLQLACKPKAEIRAKVDALLAKLALTDFRDRFPKDLSGGMKQRVAIARCLALDSPTLLMDEPFGALDALTRRSLQDELLRIWQDFRRTIVFVTHGIDESIYIADRIIVMTYRPGTIKQIVPITLPRPRDPSSPEFNAIERELTRLVMEEQLRHQKDEARATAGH
ncbi:MAG: ABC transporter ATP-binding protein [Verrucomicrobia bacterium]|nr:ABC transporter ATP-binding protein [Verrucomicrobiota bacterium]MBV9657297.1 ABC transporter ATP-binding protein [Verrucomicrobiota bacterium]